MNAATIGVIAGIVSTDALLLLAAWQLFERACDRRLARWEKASTMRFERLMSTMERMSK